MKHTITVNSSKIEQVWKALTERKITARPLSERRARDMAEAGWVHHHEIGDALSSMDNRIDYTWLSRMPDIVETIGLRAEVNFPREWKYADEITGWKSLSSSDALRYFWWLDRLGFPLNLGSLCDEIVKTLPRTRYLSESHLDVLLYRTERYSQPPIKLMVEDAESLDVSRADRFTSENGVVIEISYNEHGEVLSLVSTASDYSPPRPQIVTTCETCGQTYTQGLRGEENSHAIRHRKIVEPLDPKPSLAWRAALKADPEAVWVDENSPTWMHVAMYRRARAFKREFTYDFVQWNDRPDANEGGVAFAFLDNNFRMIGGCGFEIGGGAGGCNRLNWIWLCPDARRLGHLSRNWARFQEKMGKFDLEPPVSDAMQAFMRPRS